MNEEQIVINAADSGNSPESHEEAAKPSHAPKRKVPAPLIAAAGAVALAAVCAIGLAAGAGAGGTTAGNAPDPEPASEAPQIAVPDDDRQPSDKTGQTAAAARKTEESHTWKPVYEEVSTEAKTHTEHVEATYKEVTELETLCNVCKQDVTGHAREHSEQTGHEGFTTNVPVEKAVVDVPAHDETVTDSPAGTEKKLVGYACSCGKELTLEEAKQTGVWSADDEKQQ